VAVVTAAVAVAVAVMAMPRGGGEKRVATQGYSARQRESAYFYRS